MQNELKGRETRVKGTPEIGHGADPQTYNAGE